MNDPWFLGPEEPDAVPRCIRWHPVRMEKTPAEKELDRIERELDSKPPAKPPKDGKLTAGGAEKPSKHSSLDAVLVGAVLLAAIGLITVLGESLNEKQKTQLSSGAIGGAVGLLIGYGIGRIKP